MLFKYSLRSILRKFYFGIYEPKQKYNWYKLDSKLVNTFISKISYILNNLFQLYFWTQLFFLSRSWFMDKIITVLGYKKFITEMSDAPDWLCLHLQSSVLHTSLIYLFHVNHITCQALQHICLAFSRVVTLKAA